jgi:2,3-bisphosphoglycerate-independent phosphoglycerate mutase
VPAALQAGYVVLITGDHGNAEDMLESGGKAKPAHTTNKVPFVVLGLDPEELREGVCLEDDFTIGAFGATALALHGLPPPATWNISSALRGEDRETETPFDRGTWADPCGL